MALAESKPKLAQALAAKEIHLRVHQLKAARVHEGMEIWQVAEKLGWSQNKIERIENGGSGILLSDLRKYLLAIGCYIDFTVYSEKNLG